MLGWLVALFIITLTAGIFAFGGFSNPTTILAHLIFYIFAVLFSVVLFVFIGTRDRTKK